ncbi:MAG TPA: hypothetical protein VLG50_00360 [Candidatus Saccharimonadales bacterium]|nr:hypothetical protein [Candidatus Saccharimonadales bacterium]
MSSSQKVFPDEVKIKNINIPAGAKVNNVANQTVEVSGGQVGEGAKYSQYAGFKTPEEVKLAEESGEKARALIEKQGIKQYGSSMRIFILLGKSTLIETFTPDPDGYTRDLNHNVGAEGASFMYFQVKNAAQEARDVQSAIEDPEKNYKVLAAIRMR